MFELESSHDGAKVRPMIELQSVLWLSYSESHDCASVGPMIGLQSTPRLSDSTVHPMVELLYCPSHDGANNNNSFIQRSFIYRSSNTSQIIISQLGHFQFYSFII